MPLLQPGGVVIPATAVVYGQLVQSPVLAAQACQPRQQSVSEPGKPQDRDAADVAEAKEKARPEAANQKQDAMVANVGVQMHVLHVGPLYPNHLELLSEPFEVFKFDFGQPPKGHHSHHLQVRSSLGTVCLYAGCPHFVGFKTANHSDILFLPVRGRRHRQRLYKQCIL